MDEKERQRIQAVYDDLFKVKARMGDALDQLQAILESQPSPGQKAKRVLDTFCKRWAEHHPNEKYIVNGPKDIGALKRLLAAGLTVDDLEARIVRYLQTDDKFYASARHSFGVFVASVNAHGAGGRGGKKYDENKYTGVERADA